MKKGYFHKDEANESLLSQLRKEAALASEGRLSQGDAEARALCRTISGWSCEPPCDACYNTHDNICEGYYKSAELFLRSQQPHRSDGERAFYRTQGQFTLESTRISDAIWQLERGELAPGEIGALLKVDASSLLALEMQLLKVQIASLRHVLTDVNGWRKNTVYAGEKPYRLEEEIEVKEKLLAEKEAKIQSSASSLQVSGSGFPSSNQDRDQNLKSNGGLLQKN